MPSPEKLELYQKLERSEGRILGLEKQVMFLTIEQCFSLYAGDFTHIFPSFIFFIFEMGLRGKSIGYIHVCSSYRLEVKLSNIVSFRVLELKFIISAFPVSEKGRAHRFLYLIITHT